MPATEPCPPCDDDPMPTPEEDEVFRQQIEAERAGYEAWCERVFNEESDSEM